MAGWHNRLDGRESEWTPGVGDGQGGLACCNSWGRKELDTTERLNWAELRVYLYDILDKGGAKSNWTRVLIDGSILRDINKFHIWLCPIQWCVLIHDENSNGMLIKNSSKIMLIICCILKGLKSLGQSDKYIYIFVYFPKCPLPPPQVVYYAHIYGTSLVDQMVNNLPAMWETQIWSLGWENPLEKGKATHSVCIYHIYHNGVRAFRRQGQEEFIL